MSNGALASSIAPRGVLEELRAFQNLLAEISAGFVNLPAAAVDGAIVNALRRFVGLLDVDRASLVRFDGATGDAVITHSWALDGVPTPVSQSVGFAFPWGFGHIRAGRTVVVQSVDDLPREAATDQARWRQIGVQSNLSVPLTVGGEIVGALAFGCLRRRREWAEDLVERVRVLGAVFANALAHKRAQEALDASIGFEQLVSEILAALLTARPDDLDRVIEAGLADMAKAFGAERATLWQRVGDERTFAKSHRWLAPGVPVPDDSTGAAAIPWATDRVLAGEVVRFGRVADLPAAASMDLAALQALGIRAAVMVPLTVGSAIAGALSFATTTADREWPDAQVSRVQLVGEVLATVLARQAAERRERDAQSQATHAVRVGMMGAFAAALVHELTQPLAASLANAETLVDLLGVPAPDLAEARLAAADILKDDRNAGELIQQLRSFLRRSETTRQRLELRSVVAEVLRLAGRDAADKGIVFTLDLSAPVPEVLADRVQVQQVLLNLVLNAFDAVAANAPDARRVALTVQPTAAGVVLEVSDTGPGMAPATAARIFEPFFTTKPGGMGLGLSISRTIVAAHGGTLSVRSAEGKGSAFRVELPAWPGEGAAHARRPGDEAAAERLGGTVFVIDDEPSMRRALERQLRAAGYRVETFASAQDFLARAPKAADACIVSDVRMPGQSGLDLHAVLVAEHRALPVVFMSGHGDVPTTVHAMKAGAVDFLPKPFTKTELLAAVAAALARSRAQAGDREERGALQARYDALTPREREVFALVAAGILNKVIGDRLGVTEHTVKVHRGRVMDKMGARSVADLVRMAERLARTTVARH